MNEQQFQTNLLRVLVAKLHFSNLIQFAFQKQGKSFLDLTEAERVDIILQVQDHIQALFQRVTPEAHSSTCCHTFRATGITAYLDNGGTIENAQAIAAHESPRTTKLYDRTSDEITLDEVERIAI